jgi:hypothetical protein
MRASWVFGALAALGAACGPDSHTSPDAARPDVAEGPPSCNSSGVMRALVVGINGDTDSIRVFALDGGVLVDASLEFPADNPDDVAIRSDGLEALVSYGGFGQDYGVYVLELGLGGQQARIKQTLEVGTDHTTWGLAYADDDHAVLAAAAGGTGHFVVTLERTGTGDWAAGMMSPVPGDWPLQLQRRPGASEVLLARADLSADDDTDFYRLARDGSGAYATTGTPAMIVGTPLDMAIAPDGNTMFAATGDPDDPVTSANIDGKGLVHAAPITSSGIGTATTVSIGTPGGMVAADPKGAFIVVDSPIFELDPNTNTPISHERRLYTIPLSGGTLGTPKMTSETTPALLLYGLEVAPSGHVIRSRQLYGFQAPEAEQTPLDILLPDGNGNFEVCATRFLPGQGRFAIATPYAAPQ